MNILIKTGQNGYSPKQVQDRAITVGELIEQLESMRDDFGDDIKVIMQSYGNGAVWEPVRFAEEDDSDENEDW